MEAEPLHTPDLLRKRFPDSADQWTGDFGAQVWDVPRRNFEPYGLASDKAVNENAGAFLKSESVKDLLSELPDLSKLVPKPLPAHEAYLESWINTCTSRLILNKEVRDNVNHVGAGILKTAGLFSGGKLGIAATMVAYGLDQAKPDESPKMQVIDFALGAAKGLAVKEIFAMVVPSSAVAPLKGALIGLGAGAAEEVFRRETLDDLPGLRTRLDKSVFNPHTIALNAVMSTAAEGIYATLNISTGGKLEQIPLLSSIVTGGSFGFVKGTIKEASREMNDTGSLDSNKVLLKGLLEAFASSTGGVIARRFSDPGSQPVVEESRSETR